MNTKQKDTTESFIKKANLKHNNKYDYSKVNYVNSYTKIIIMCPLHGEFIQIPNGHLNGKGCKLCSRQKTIEGKTKPKHGNSLLDKHPILCKEWSSKNTQSPQDYAPNSSKKVWWKCSKCNREWQAIICNRTGINKNGCAACSQKCLSDKNRLSIIYPKISKEWDYSKNIDTPNDVSYGSDKKRWWICNKCKNSYKSTISLRTSQNCACPNCKSSKGENKINDVLSKLDISFKFQFRIQECRYKNPLPFDFAIFKNNKLVGLIEYNGQQHYFAFGHFGSDKHVEEIKFRDKIKKDYCKNNNIPLLIIPYTRYKNIKELLMLFIKEII